MLDVSNHIYILNFIGRLYTYLHFTLFYTMFLLESSCLNCFKIGWHIIFLIVYLFYFLFYLKHMFMQTRLIYSLKVNHCSITVHYRVRVFSAGQKGAVQWTTVQCRKVQCSALQYSAASTVQCTTIQCSKVQCSALVWVLLTSYSLQFLDAAMHKRPSHAKQTFYTIL